MKLVGDPEREIETAKYMVRFRARVCACVCVYVRICVCVCVCVVLVVVHFFFFLERHTGGNILINTQEE